MQRCARCHLGISASEMVMRARDSVYHLSCFTCSTCNKTLTTGDHFGMKDSLVYCRAHFETLLQGEYPPQLSYTELAAKSGGLALPYFNGTGTVQKGRPRKRKSPALGVDIVSYNSGEPKPEPRAPLSPHRFSCPGPKESSFQAKVWLPPRPRAVAPSPSVKGRGGKGRSVGGRASTGSALTGGCGDFPQRRRAKSWLPIS